MVNVITVENMRKSDATTIATSISSKELMYRAGVASFDMIKNKLGDLANKKVLILAGSGNNAGDGYVMADLFIASGADVSIFLIKNKFSADGQYYFDKVKDRVHIITDLKELNKNINCKENISDEKNIDCNKNKFNDNDSINQNKLCDYDIIIDCILGTGFNGILEGTYIGDVIKTINEWHKKKNGLEIVFPYVVAIDINSGLNGNTGFCDVCIESDLTISIGTYKLGHFLNMAKDVMEEKVNVDIGIELVAKPYILIEESDIKKVFVKRKNFSNKGSYGYIALIGGSERYAGAIRLAEMANAAMRCGAGVVKVATTKSLCNLITPLILESTLYPLSDNGENIVFVKDEIDGLIKNISAVACGMGIGVNVETEKLVLYLLENYKGRLLFDADALTALANVGIMNLFNTNANVVLTPHFKEFGRLLKNVDEEFYRLFLMNKYEIDLLGMNDEEREEFIQNKYNEEKLSEYKNKEWIINDIEKNGVCLAKAFASRYKVVLLLKGTTTIVTNGEEVYLIDRGCAGMATAGSGDVLSGILSAILGSKVYGEDIVFQIVVGAYINGVAGEFAEKENGTISMIASDTVKKIKKVCQICD